MSHFHEDQIDVSVGDSLLFGVIVCGVAAVDCLIGNEDRAQSRQTQRQQVANPAMGKNFAVSIKSYQSSPAFLKAKENEKKIQKIRARVAEVSQKLSLPDGKQNAEFNLGNISFKVDQQEEKVYVRVKR